MSPDVDWIGPFSFADWPVDAVPSAAAGVYVIWEDDVLLYVGMSGRGRSRAHLDEAGRTGRRVGLWNRLDSHASGRRGADQFCVYVADRLVLPDLTPDQIGQIGNGQLRLDELVKQRIRERMSFSFTLTHDGAAAAALERSLRERTLGAVPLLNPLPGGPESP